MSDATAEKLFIVDADSHWSEPADLFTSRAPAEYRDRVPRVEEVDGERSWVFDGHVVGRHSAAGVIGRDGKKEQAEKALFEWDHDMVHVGAYDPKVRLGVLDEVGIDAQIIFPSTIGLGGQDLGMVEDEALKRVSVEIYNDAMAEIQADSGNRLLPLPLMPAWSVDACVAEAKRIAALGARGVNMTSDPDDLGAPDLANRAWDPLWETCTELQLPVHFHIGASVTGMTFYGRYPWDSHGPNTKLAIGGTLLFIGNARVVTNLILSGMFDRHPDLQMVSVESGIGWIPFILETLDYEMAENAPEELSRLEEASVGVLPHQPLRHVLVREEPQQAARPGRGGGRGPDPVRDRLPPPDLPVPRPAEVGGDEDGHAVARGPPEDHGRERSPALPPVTA